MSLMDAFFAQWLFRSAVGGGFLLFFAWIAMRWTNQPARRQRVGELAVAGALILALLSFGPAWLVVSVPVAVPEVPVQQALQATAPEIDAHPADGNALAFAPFPEDDIGPLPAESSQAEISSPVATAGP